MQICLASQRGVTFQKCEINWYGPIRLKPPLACHHPPPLLPPPSLSASRLVRNCFAFACSHPQLLIIWCCVAAFGWNSEKPQRAAAWPLACTARMRLKAYPGGGEAGGRRRGSQPSHSRTKRKPAGLSWPARGGRGDAQREEGTITKLHWGGVGHYVCVFVTSNVSMWEPDKLTETVQWGMKSRKVLTRTDASKKEVVTGCGLILLCSLVCCDPCFVVLQANSCCLYTAKRPHVTDTSSMMRCDQTFRNRDIKSK